MSCIELLFKIPVGLDEQGLYLFEYLFVSRRWIAGQPKTWGFELSEWFN
jgi:hypothetical protein